jgi:hypothetical protein
MSKQNWTTLTAYNFNLKSIISLVIKKHLKKNHNTTTIHILIRKHNMWKIISENILCLLFNTILSMGYKIHGMLESSKINAYNNISQSTYIFFIILFDLLLNSKKWLFLNQSSNLNFQCVHEKVIKIYRYIINITLRNLHYKYKNYLLTYRSETFLFRKIIMLFYSHKYTYLF